MSWNYRVVRSKDTEQLFSIREAYYDADGSIWSYADATVTDWDSIEDLRETLLHMLESLDKPVL